jgi:hypothetical protein
VGREVGPDCLGAYIGCFVVTEKGRTFEITELSFQQFTSRCVIGDLLVTTARTHVGDAVPAKGRDKEVDEGGGCGRSRGSAVAADTGGGGGPEPRGVVLRGPRRGSPGTRAQWPSWPPSAVRVGSRNEIWRGTRGRSRVRMEGERRDSPRDRA